MQETDSTSEPQYPREQLARGTDGYDSGDGEDGYEASDDPYDDNETPLLEADEDYTDVLGADDGDDETPEDFDLYGLNIRLAEVDEQLATPLAELHALTQTHDPSLEAKMGQFELYAVEKHIPPDPYSKARANLAELERTADGPALRQRLAELRETMAPHLEAAEMLVPKVTAASLRAFENVRADMVGHTDWVSVVAKAIATHAPDVRSDLDRPYRNTVGLSLSNVSLEYEPGIHSFVRLQYATQSLQNLREAVVAAGDFVVDAEPWQPPEDWEPDMNLPKGIDEAVKIMDGMVDILPSQYDDVARRFVPRGQMHALQRLAESAGLNTVVTGMPQRPDLQPPERLVYALQHEAMSLTAQFINGIAEYQRKGFGP